MHTKTLSEVRADLKNKNYSIFELTQHFLNRIKKFNPSINAFITVTADLALEQAKKADLKIARGSYSDLTGIPIAHKDIFCTKNVKTSCGSRMLDNFISPYDATIVKKLQDAGTILLGKTNMDEFAMGSSTETSYYGPTRNPWDEECVPGGSSGGSAAAISAGLTLAATGSDTGGSIRQPAALCGLSGIKPTYGRISRYGLIAYASSLDQAGPMAKSTQDLALLLQEMAGFDPKDSTSINQDVPNYSEFLSKPITDLKVGLPKGFIENGLDLNMTNKLQDFLRLLEKLGVQLIDIELPHHHLAVPTYYIIAPAECSSNLARYDGVRYGYRCQSPKNLIDLYERTRGEGFGTEVKRRIMIGTYTLSAGYYDAYYLKAQKVRKLIREDYLQAFQKVDVIVSPTTPTPTFKLGEKTTNPIEMYLSDIYTIGANLAGLPSLSIPIGFINNKPIGALLTGNYFSEGTLLNIGHQYQQNTDWHLRMPEKYKLN